MRLQQQCWQPVVAVGVRTMETTLGERRVVFDVNGKKVDENHYVINRTPGDDDNDDVGVGDSLWLKQMKDKSDQIMKQKKVHHSARHASLA